MAAASVVGAWRTCREGIRAAFEETEIASALAVALAAFAALATLLFDPRDPARLARFLPEHVANLNIYDSHTQRVAFLVFFFAVVFTAPVMALFAKKITVRFSDQPLLIGPTILFLIASILGRFGRLREGLLIAPLVLFAAIAPDVRKYLISIWLGVAALTAIAVIPGLVGTPIVEPMRYVTLDTNFAAVFSHGERLAAGRQLFVDVFPDYGVLAAAFIGVLSKSGHAPSLYDLIRFLQIGQVLCLAVFFAVAWQRTRGATPGGRTLALLVVALVVVPRLGTLAEPIWLATGSGYRFLMLPVGVLVAGLLKDLSARSAGAAIGAIAGIALLYNPETGIAVGAGLGMGWLLRMRAETLQVVVTSFIAGLVAFALALAAFALFYRVNFGAWPLPESLQAFAEFAFLFGGGYAGTRLRFNAVALIILLHAGYILAQAIRTLVSRNTAGPDPASASIAAMLLVFFPYYVNRPVDWNLWIYVALYSLLLAPMIAGETRRLVPLVIAAFLLVPQAFDLRKNALAPLASSRLVWGWKQGCADGLLLPTDKDYCGALSARAATIKRMAAERAAVWVTRMPFTMMRMTGLAGPFQAIDLFGMTPTHAAFERFATRLRDLKPQALLLDNPDDPLFPLRGFEAYNQRVIGVMRPAFCVSRVVGGWQVAEPSDNCVDKR